MLSATPLQQPPNDDKVADTDSSHSHVTITMQPLQDSLSLDNKIIARFLEDIQQSGIKAQEVDGRTPPREALMHDRGAVIPRLVVSPQSESEVSRTLMLLKRHGLYRNLPVSVKSGGHGYFNGASCAGIMINLASMTSRRIQGNTMFLEPGCALGQVLSTLREHRKAVPHGDGFGVGAGGHFLTAGWDLILSRRYGLGCQSVVGGRIVLWDGSTVEVNENSHPQLLYAMRGGAVAEAGVVTEIRLRLIDEPSCVVWRFAPITKEQLEMCVAQNAFSNAVALPNDISLSFRFHFEQDQPEPVCSFNIVSLLSADETIHCLNQYLGKEVTSFLGAPGTWSNKGLLDLRMEPASELLAAEPEILADISTSAFHENPLAYWNQTSSLQEMARSYFTSISHWIVPECEAMLLDLYEAFQDVRQQPLRTRMFAYILLGGGRMLEMQESCAMPLGGALARFELHWDNPETESQWCRRFTDRISRTIQSKADLGPGRPYRGDIWLAEQAKDNRLDAILRDYDRRDVLAESTLHKKRSAWTTNYLRVNKAENAILMKIKQLCSWQTVRQRLKFQR
ncbi:hypothetical protein NQ176_g2665 [Zarea fungicola]|uniref:Uncharacterized protein n=1 Tax=Zarea fungicola TaxID=93591 RepID=A0ACC1NMS7_9HYPO|nr:hypothetical protein NQ176_g2665 [Lecanicillium fungicola]